MSWEVFTFGGGEYLFEIFNGIAALTSGDNYLNIIKISGLFGLAWVIVQTAFNLNYKTVINWFVSFILVYNVMFLPKTSVLINDQLDTISYRVVDNVPLALAVFASLSSEIGKSITEGFESTFSSPDDLKYHKNGMLFGSKLLQMSTGIEITDSNFAANINSYMKQCVFYDLLLNRYALNDLKKSDDLWNFLTVENTPSQARSFLLKSKTGDSILTCKDGVMELNKVWADQISQSSTIFGQLLFPKVSKDQAKRLLLQYLPVSYNELLGVSKNASELIKQNMLINALDSAAADFSNTGTSGTNIYTTVRSNIQTKAAFNASQRQAEEWVPIIKIVMEVLFYGAFPLVFLLFLLPIGPQVLKGYLATFIWLQAWGPLYAILNLMMTKYASYKSLAATSSYGLSVVTQSGVLSVQQDVAEISGYLVWFIPFIAAGLTKGMISITGLATSMLAVPQSAANAAANEAATGNVSLGNTNMDNASYGNLSSNKVNDSTFFDSARVQAINHLGGMTTVTPDGRTVYDQTGTVSKIPNVQLSSNDSMSQAYSETASKISSTGENLAKQASISKAKTMDELSQYMASHNINENHGIRFTDHAAAGTKEAYQRLENVAENFARSYGVDKVTAFNAVLGGNVGASIGKEGGVGRSISGNAGIDGSIGGKTSDGYNNVESIGNTKQLQHDIDVVFNAVKDKSLEFTNSHGHSLNESINAGIQEAERLESQSRIYLDTAKTLNEQAQFQTSSSVSATIDWTPQLIDKLASTKKLNGETLGGQGVLKMMATNPEGAAKLLKEHIDGGSRSIKNNFDHKKEHFEVNNLHGEYQTRTNAMPDGLNNADKVAQYFNKATQGKSIDNSGLMASVDEEIGIHQQQIQDIELDKNDVRREVKNKLKGGAFMTVIKSINPFKSEENPKSNFDDKNNK